MQKRASKPDWMERNKGYKDHSFRAVKLRYQKNSVTVFMATFLESLCAQNIPEFVLQKHVSSSKEKESTAILESPPQQVEQDGATLN